MDAVSSAVALIRAGNLDGTFEYGEDKDVGAGFVEYALLVAFIASLAVVGITAFGTQLDSFFSRLFADLGI
jgi:Flp pilus assembly pilin Flp